MFADVSFLPSGRVVFSAFVWHVIISSQAGDPYIEPDATAARRGLQNGSSNKKNPIPSGPIEDFLYMTCRTPKAVFCNFCN